GYFVDVLTTPLESFSTSFGIRLDNHESFDSEVTFRVAPVVKLEDSGTRIRGSVASGFKAPSLSQLYSSFGNPELEPEESIGWEIGIDQEFAEGLVRFGATFFRNDIDQLISFNSETFRSENIAEAEITGFELSLEVEPVEHLLLKADYTFTDAEDKNLRTQLLRRPENKFAFSGFYSFLEDRGQVGVRANVVGHRSDTDFSTFPSQSVRLGGYTVVDLLGSYRITETLEFFARVENLFDREYQDVFGFGTPGVAGYGGLRVRFS
ncbi:MAG: TonB-dependent receptor, partial [Bdellovibrionales bacterium]|nr:TonB-dependent receptor [Bdellovibrionales bacterium]